MSRVGSAADFDAGAAVFADHRAHLFGLAYRMLGSVSEAEDVVQEAYLRWAGAARDEVERPGAWLTTVTSRICLDRLTSARARRETYVGPWLPEPLLTDDADPATAAELSDSLTTAFLMVLERLNPIERAVFLLHDIFGYGFEEVGDIVRRPPASCRQVASRARARVDPDRPRRYRPDPDEERQLLGAFLEAAQAGDLERLVAVLADDVVLWSDGGADHHAARRPVVGRDRVARFIANLGRRLPPDGDVHLVRIGGDPGLVLSRGHQPQLALACELAPGSVRRIYAVVNPEKLAHLRDVGPH